ncbi:MAG: BCCT family transporter [Gammaproteobacteria bacterium]|nr:BCCT family transporter [Gammaproteobacteria bacterium]
MDDSPAPINIHSSRENIDWMLFGIGSTLLLLVVLIIVVFPAWSTASIDALYRSVTGNFGSVFVYAAVLILGFLLFIGFSPYGNVVLGESNKPAYSNFSWASMLFCAGIGASLIYWSATEWAFYYVEPPFGIQARSDEAITWAVSYGIFHWGPVGWAFYCLPALALACSYHVKKIPALRLSSACSAVLGNSVSKWPGRIIDLFFIVGVLGTAATGMGFGTSLVASAVNQLTGIEDGILLQAAIILLATGLIAFSVYRGLDKGIRVLSNINASMALLFVVFVFLVGPTKFILEMGTVALGNVTQNFITMLFWTDPLEQGDFVENWTIFYWAWWLAMGPFIGMFVCKISEGRTIRQLIFGMLGWGSIGCALFFIVLGNFALSLELAGRYPVIEQAVGVSPSAAIAGMVALLPAGSAWLVFVALIGLIFMSTTYDSASYTIAAGTTRELTEHQHPARWNRVFWALALGLLPISLLFIGGLRELQTASLVASLPLLIIYLILALSITRWMREFKAAGKTQKNL